LPSANQIGRQLTGIEIAAEQLLEVPQGQITEQGIRTNVSVGIQYLEAWLRGFGEELEKIKAELGEEALQQRKFDLANVLFTLEWLLSFFI
jgi:hypothetical protein